MEIKTKDKMWKISQFLIGGGVGLAMRFLALYFLTEFLGVWYLLSAVIAYLLNNLINFVIHKFWTFNDKDLTKLNKEVVSYVQMMSLFFICNTVYLYVLVDYIHVHYLIAQLILTTFLSIIGFLRQQEIFENKILYSKLH